MDPERWQRVKDLCNGALDLDTASRDAFLDHECREGAALHAEVRSLLSCAPQADGFLETAGGHPSSLRAEPGAPDARTSPLFAVADRDACDLAGQRILHYNIIERVGEGGMGVVYRAEDSRLGRSVALKFLSDALSGDHQALDRFRREARTIAALNHPRICTLHDVGAHGGRTFLVLEYLDGRTLAATLARGPIPLHKALDIAAQILEGLEAAHARGIVHRDLKPGNVMVTATGVKLLDFGLAKATATSVVMPPLESAPMSITDSTLILGTIPYMSPEQLEARPVDARTDIWALGTILYEMIAGRRAFEAASQASLVASILDREPPRLAAMAPLTPPVVDHVVARCLAKSPDERWAASRDLADAIRAVRDGAAIGPLATVPARPTAWRAAVAATVLLLGVAVAMRTPPRRFTIVLPADKPLAPGAIMPEAADRPALALSRDGQRLAYVAQIADTTQICIRDMSTGTVVPLPGSEAGHSPFFSPDGAGLAFFAEGKLKKALVAGGVVDSIADAPNPYGGTWGDDGWIYFTRHSQEGVHRVRADAASAVEVVTPGLARMPEVLGPGQGLLATTGEGTYLVAGPQGRRFVVRGFGARLLPTGHLLYALAGRLVASRFDIARLDLAAATVTVLDDLRTAPFGVAQFAFGHDGTLVYATGRPQTMTSFVWVDREGRTRSAGLPEAKYSAFDLSPDGTRLALGVEAADGRVTELQLVGLADHQKSSLTARVTLGEPGLNSYPRWTPDGHGVVSFKRSGEGVFQLTLQVVDGSVEPVELWSNRRGGSSYFVPMAFAPDGTLIALGTMRPGSFDIVRFVRDERSGLWTHGPEIVLATPYSEYFGQVSPDGRWLLFTSDQSGRDEIYVTSYPTPGVMRRVSSGGGHKAAWNGTSEIVYKVGTEMYAVDVALAPSFRAGQPKRLFTGAFPNVPGFDFAVAPGGQEFLMLENKGFLQAATTLTVITGFFEDLNRRAPVRGQ
jgi:eukaryotic-like serine/threonine-protein kinase